MSGARYLEVWGSQRWLYLRWTSPSSAEHYTLLDSFKEFFPTDRTYEHTTRSWSLHRRHRRLLETWANLHFAPEQQDWDTSARKRGLAGHGAA